MKINKTDKVMGIYLNNLNNNIRANKKNKLKRDELSVSEKAKDYLYALEKFKKLPDIREAKIERLKKEVQAGTYNVEGRKIAKKMLEKIKFDKRI